MKQKRAYKYRWYPTDEQKQILAKSISDVGWGQFVRKLEYKAQGGRMSSTAITLGVPTSTGTWCPVDA